MTTVTIMNMTKEELCQTIIEVIEKQLSKKHYDNSFDSNLMNQDEAAAFLGVSKTTFIDFKKKGLLTYRKLGRRYYFTKQDLLKNMFLIEGGNK